MAFHLQSIGGMQRTAAHVGPGEARLTPEFALSPWWLFIVDRRRQSDWPKPAVRAHASPTSAMNELKDKATHPLLGCACLVSMMPNFSWRSSLVTKLLFACTAAVNLRPIVLGFPHYLRPKEISWWPYFV